MEGLGTQELLILGLIGLAVLAILGGVVAALLMVFRGKGGHDD